MGVSFVLFDTSNEMVSSICRMLQLKGREREGRPCFIHHSLTFERFHHSHMRKWRQPC